MDKETKTNTLIEPRNGERLTVLNEQPPSNRLGFRLQIVSLSLACVGLILNLIIVSAMAILTHKTEMDNSVLILSSFYIIPFLPIPFLSLAFGQILNLKNAEELVDRRRMLRNAALTVLITTFTFPIGYYVALCLAKRYG